MRLSKGGNGFPELKYIDFWDGHAELPVVLTSNPHNGQGSTVLHSWLQGCCYLVQVLYTGCNKVVTTWKSNRPVHLR